LPHLQQNWASLGSSCPHFAQYMTALR
jgi:hypothetical protein